MRLYYLILFIFLPIHGMVNHLRSQDPNKCPLMKLPMNITAHILSYVIAPYYPDVFYLGKTKRARAFLTTCKYYHTSKELTQAIIAQLTNEYGLPRLFIFAPLWLGTPTAHDCLKEWLQKTTEVNVLGLSTTVTIREKIVLLYNLLKEITSSNEKNPNGQSYTQQQSLYLTTKIMTIKSLAHKIA